MRGGGSLVVLRSIEDAARVLSRVSVDVAEPFSGEGGRVGLALDGPPGPALRAARAAGVSVVRVVPGLGRVLRARRPAPPPGWAGLLAELILRHSEFPKPGHPSHLETSQDENSQIGTSQNETCLNPGLERGPAAGRAGGPS